MTAGKNSKRKSIFILQVILITCLIAMSIAYIIFSDGFVGVFILRDFFVLADIILVGSVNFLAVAAIFLPDRFKILFFIIVLVGLLLVGARLIK